jgi:tetratricopeptide (TPR) repeat protein
LSAKVQAYCNLAEPHEARGTVEATLARLPAVKDEVIRGFALAKLSMYYAHLGDFTAAQRALLDFAAIARRTGDRTLIRRQLANIGLHYCQLGRYAEARAAHEEGLAIAAAVGDRNTEAMHRWNLSYVLWCLGDPSGAVALGESVLLELRQTEQNPRALATCLGHLGLIAEDTGSAAAAEAYLAEARQLNIDTAWTGQQMELQAVEARCLLRLGRLEEARRLAVDAWEYTRTHGHVMIDFPSRVYLCVADVVARIPDPWISEAEALEAGYRELTRTAETIEDPEWRRSFLEDEVSNLALLARWNSRSSCERPEPSCP